MSGQVSLDGRVLDWQSKWSGFKPAQRYLNLVQLKVVRARVGHSCGTQEVAPTWQPLCMAADMHGPKHLSS